MALSRPLSPLSLAPSENNSCWTGLAVPRRRGHWRCTPASCIAESEPGGATVAAAGHCVRTGVGSSQYRAEVDHAGHRQ